MTTPPSKSALAVATNAVMERFALFRDPAHCRRLGIDDKGAELSRYEVEDIVRTALDALRPSATDRLVSTLADKAMNDR